MSRYIGQRFLVIQAGPMYVPKTWLDVGYYRGHNIQSFRDFWGKPGEFRSAEQGTGIVFYNTAYSPEAQCHILVHELAHAELNVLASGLYRGEVPGFLAGEFCRANYNDPLDMPTEQVANEVEWMCLRR